MKKVILIILLLLIECNDSVAVDKIDYYMNLFKVNCLGEKIVDNHGNGFPALYGLRNMRPVLHGIAYRGGANNFYHNISKRDNHNPLPDDGLQNLAELGFSKAIYLYSTNFETARKEIKSKDGNNTLRYIRRSSLNGKEMREIFTYITDAISNPETGPIYFHCWNGWHQSGYLSAAILIQFCGFSNDEAYNYWLKNTDGVNKGYESVKNKVQAFRPFPDISIDKMTQERICPCNK